MLALPHAGFHLHLGGWASSSREAPACLHSAGCAAAYRKGDPPFNAPEGGRMLANPHDLPFNTPVGGRMLAGPSKPPWAVKTGSAMATHPPEGQDEPSLAFTWPPLL